jgi:hypothetical protein
MVAVDPGDKTCPQCSPPHGLLAGLIPHGRHCQAPAGMSQHMAGGQPLSAVFLKQVPGVQLLLLKSGNTCNAWEHLLLGEAKSHQ